MYETVSLKSCLCNQNIVIVIFGTDNYMY